MLCYNVLGDLIFRSRSDLVPGLVDIYGQWNNVTLVEIAYIGKFEFAEDYPTDSMSDLPVAGDLFYVDFIIYSAWYLSAEARPRGHVQGILHIARGEYISRVWKTHRGNPCRAGMRCSYRLTH
jgi:hypothetical protein